MIVDHDVRFVTTSAGDPRRYIERLKDAGIVVYHAAPSLEGALKAEDAGVDGLIVEGAESNIDKIVASDSELIRNRSRLVFLPVPLVHDPLHLAFAKSMHKKDVLERFNEALKKFKKAEIAKEMSSVPLHERPR